MSIVRVIAAITLAFSTSVSADADLRQQLTKPVVAVLNSTRSPSELQLCAADAIGEGLLPLPFPPDSDGTIHIFGFGGVMGAGTVQRTVSLVRTRNGTQIEVRTRSGRRDERL